MFSFRRSRVLLLSVWLLAFAAVAVVAWQSERGYFRDAGGYQRAIDLLRDGKSPYAVAADGMEQARLAGKGYPFAYVYTPITLPLLRFLGQLPNWSYQSIFCLLYLAGALAQVFAAQIFLRPAERSLFWYLAPLLFFFPGFLYTDTELTGNVAFIWYGALLLLMVRGWRTERWRGFYLLVLLVAAVKPPLLTLLAVPLLSTRRQWLPAITTGIAGVLVFAAQSWFMPVRYAEYMRLMSDVMRDYSHLYVGFAPNEVVSYLLKTHAMPNSSSGPMTYAITIALILPLLFWGRNRYFSGRADFADWAPCLLIGVVLLCPRLKEQDITPITIPLALVLWRTLHRALKDWRKALAAALVFWLGVNVLNNTVDELNCPLQVSILLALFALSLRNVFLAQNPAAQAQ